MSLGAAAETVDYKQVGELQNLYLVLHLHLHVGWLKRVAEKNDDYLVVKSGVISLAKGNWMRGPALVMKNQVLKNAKRVSDQIDVHEQVRVQMLESDCSTLTWVT